MKKQPSTKELQEKIAQMDARIRQLEARPINQTNNYHYHYGPQPVQTYPYYIPPQPWQPWSYTTSGTSLTVTASDTPATGYVTVQN